MRTFTILLFSILISCSNKEKTECNYITDYYPNTANAEVEYYLGNYEKAFDYYQKAFENCDAITLGTHHDTDKFAKICAELGKNDLAIDYIEKTISNPKVFQKQDKIFSQKLLKAGFPVQ
ncbi:MAG TPA: tetratricopeptide repeat protein [Aequorivita sp.]|nr:tetratricopeptide repeat protein [Aequorivita sp.]